MSGYLWSGHIEDNLGGSVNTVYDKRWARLFFRGWRGQCTIRELACNGMIGACYPQWKCALMPRQVRVLKE